MKTLHLQRGWCRPFNVVQSLTLFAVFGLVGSAHAQTLVGIPTDATGVTGLVVGTEVYDVTFLAQTYNEAYPDNDAPFLGDSVRANAARTALVAFLNTSAVTGILGFNCVAGNNQCRLNIPDASFPSLNGSNGPAASLALFFESTGWFDSGGSYVEECVGTVTGNPCYNPGYTGFQALAHFEPVTITPGVFTVNSTADNAGDLTLCPVDPGVCTLRQAINSANAHPGPDTINFSVSGTITLASELPTISDVAIDGSGQSVEISGNNQCRVFHVAGTQEVSLKSLTIKDGRASAGNTCNIALPSSSGGGLLHRASNKLNIENCTFVGNHADSYGGAIDTTTSSQLVITASTFDSNGSGNHGGALEASDTALIQDSTFRNNTGHSGGAIYASHRSGKVVTILNSTFVQNSTTVGYGGAIYADGHDTSTVKVVNSTVVGNASALALGGGIYARYGTFILQNTILAGNTTNNCLKGTHLETVLSADSSNMSTDASCDAATQKTLAELALGMLDNYGGPTQTIPISATSAAVGAGNNAYAAGLTYEQRGAGYARIVGTNVDVGAFEVQDLVAPTITITTPPNGASYTQGQVVNASYSCQDNLGGSGVASCIGDVPNGSGINTSTLGANTFTVNAQDNAGNPASLVHNYTVTSSTPTYTFTGFFQPVDNLPTLNSVKAGQAIPVKFKLGGYRGLNIFAAGYPRSEWIACNSTGSVDGVEETVNAGGSSLSYDIATDTYNYVWKTDKSWANTCRQLVIKFADNTTIARANFTFKK